MMAARIGRGHRPFCSGGHCCGRDTWVLWLGSRAYLGTDGTPARRQSCQEAWLVARHPALSEPWLWIRFSYCGQSAQRRPTQTHQGSPRRDCGPVCHCAHHLVAQQMSLRHSESTPASAPLNASRARGEIGRFFSCSRRCVQWKTFCQMKSCRSTRVVR